MVPFPLVNLTVMAFSYDGRRGMAPAAFSPTTWSGIGEGGRGWGADKLTGKVFGEDLVPGQLTAAARQAGRQAKAG